jgi:hypothetical protein
MSSKIRLRGYMDIEKGDSCLAGAWCYLETQVNQQGHGSERCLLSVAPKYREILIPWNTF